MHFLQRKTAGPLRRAALTVEAAYIVPWSVLLTALLIIVLFFVHNRVWYTAAACETALSGNRYIEGSGGTGSAGYIRRPGEENAAGSGCAEATMQQRVRDQAMPGSAPEPQISCTQSGTEVRLSGQKLPLFSERFAWTVQVSVKKVRPAQTVQGMWVLRRVLSAVSGTGRSEHTEGQ